MDLGVPHLCPCVSLFPYYIYKYYAKVFHKSCLILLIVLIEDLAFSEIVIT